MSKEAVILKAAQKLFSQFGLRKVTTDDIARVAHVSKATIYKHYSNKSAIFDDVVTREFESLLETIREAVAKETDTRARFRAHLLTKMRKLHELVNLYRVTQETWGEYWPYVVDVRNRFIAEETAIVRDILARGNESGELSVSDIDVTAHIMVVALKSMEFPWALEGLDLRLEQYVDAMIELIVTGLAPRPACA
jgi:AcrR family transcriptional regulator